MGRTLVRMLAIVAIGLSGSGCTGNGGTTDAVAEPSSPQPSPTEEAAPIPEGQSLMDPGTYAAETEPGITLTTTSPWYGAANVPGFVVFGQLDRPPYAELYLLNLDEVVRDPGEPGNPGNLRPAPEGILDWLVGDAGMEVVGEMSQTEIDGYTGRQADLRVQRDAGCVPEGARPFPQACLLFFPLSGEPHVFALAKGVTYRITELPDVEGEAVTLMYLDWGRGYDERVTVADEVVRSIEFAV
ncbi:MAG: hypothetical protein WD096_09635 [Actinomycetota bacterium]